MLPAKPPLLTCDEGTFARLTLCRRMPAVLGAVLAESPWPPPAQGRLRALLGSIPFGVIPASFGPATPDAAFWRAYLGARRGATWISLPFLEAEEIFYAALFDAISDVGSPVPDPFAPIKRRGLSQALESLPALAAAVSREDLPRAEAVAVGLRLSLAGNVADLSQLPSATTAPGARNLLCDDTSNAVRRLDAGGPSAVLDLVLDNAGEELVGDLALVDVLLRRFPVLRIRAHHKSRPHFVSDATRADWDEALSALAHHGEPEVRAWGERLRGATRAGRLCPLTHDFWCRPSPWAEMPTDLRATLREAHLIVLKGDLNYRRYVEDRAWPHNVPARALWLSDMPPVLALRVLKSELVVGVERDVAETLAVREPDWLYSGRHAMIQLFGPAALSSDASHE
jgi:uncharacterized protein with ATP-grasp and redox domains